MLVDTAGTIQPNGGSCGTYIGDLFDRQEMTASKMTVTRAQGSWMATCKKYPGERRSNFVVVTVVALAPVIRLSPSAHQ